MSPKIISRKFTNINKEEGKEDIISLNQNDYNLSSHRLKQDEEEISASEYKNNDDVIVEGVNETNFKNLKTMGNPDANGLPSLYPEISLIPQNTVRSGILKQSTIKILPGKTDQEILDDESITKRYQKFMRVRNRLPSVDFKVDLFSKFSNDPDYLNSNTNQNIQLLQELEDQNGHSFINLLEKFAAKDMVTVSKK